LGQLAEINSIGAKTESEFLSETADEGLVAGGGGATETVVQVAQDNLAMACGVQEPSESGRIGSAGAPEEQLFAFGWQVQRGGHGFLSGGTGGG
jgi:hypothetical protein